MAEEDEEWENEDEFVGFMTGEILDWIHEEYEESEESEGELSGEEEPPAAEIPASFFSDVRVDISIEYGELLLPETQFEYTQPLSFFLRNVVDETEMDDCWTSPVHTSVLSSEETFSDDVVGEQRCQSQMGTHFI